jgi:hypothetical protein
LLITTWSVIGSSSAGWGFAGNQSRQIFRPADGRAVV